MAPFLQDRDLLVFRELALCRFLTLDQIAKLCFQGRIEAAKKRLQKLQQGRFVVRHRPGVLASSLYLLTRTGSDVLDGVEKKHKTSFSAKPPAVTTLKHEIMLRDFRASIFEATARESLTVEAFSIDSKALAFVLPSGPTRPDGYLEILTAKKISRFFLEIDNGTEPLSIILEKVQAYRMFYRTGMFAQRCGSLKEDFRSYPFRVVFIFSSEARKAAFVLKLKEEGIGTFVVVASSWQPRGCDILFSNS